MRMEVLDNNLVKRAYYVTFLGTINDGELNRLLTSKETVASALNHAGLTFKALSTFSPDSDTRLIFKITDGPYKGQALVSDKISKMNVLPLAGSCTLTDIHSNIISIFENKV